MTENLNYGVMEGTFESVKEDVLFINIKGKVFPIWICGDSKEFHRDDYLEIKVHLDVTGDFNIKIIADEIKRKSI